MPQESVEIRYFLPVVCFFDRAIGHGANDFLPCLRFLRQCGGFAVVHQKSRLLSGKREVLLFQVHPHGA